MKKLLSIILTSIMLLSLAACGEKDFETLKAEYQEMTAEKLISKTFKNRENPTEEEVASLIGSAVYVDLNEKYVFEDNITDEAISTLTQELVTPATPVVYAMTLLDNEDPIVRAFVYNSFLSYTPLDDKELENHLIEKVKAETDKTAVACALRGLANALSRRTEFADFAIACAESEDAVIRYWAANAIGFYRLDDNEKCVDAMIKLIKDSDAEVAKEACGEAGSFGNDKVVVALSEILADEALADIHGSATEALEELWMGYPFYEGKSEAAYRAHLAYLNTDSTNKKIPSWLAISSITDPGGKFEEWKSTSTYYKAEELVGVLSKIVGDADVDDLAKTTAIQKIGAFGTKADLETLKAAVADDDSLVEEIDSEIAMK